jgi:predicted Zn-dependent protease
MNHQKKSILTLVALIALNLLPPGCSPRKVNTAAGLKLTFDRGAQLLASGNPKSAIPFLTQTVTSAPDGPEPVALLSLAYALDLQSDRAIREAALVRRPEGAAPGWEFVAVGIAQITANQPRTAAETLKQGLAKLEDHAPIAPAARQWLALSQILAGDDGAALETLQALAESPAMQTTTTSWEVMLHARRGRSTPASKALARCAALSANRSGELALRENLTGADPQTLCDAAIAALAAGKL